MAKHNINIYRQRIIEAIVYFSRELKNPNKTVIYKCLAMLDFRHFAQTGFSVTNLEYLAFKRGPLPLKLHKEITKGDVIALPDDFSEGLTCTRIEHKKSDDSTFYEFRFKAKRKPNTKIFTPRQIKLMEQVKDIHRETTAIQASEASHERETPWYITIHKNGKEGDLIDMLETVKLEKPWTKETVLERIRERNALDYNYGV